MTGQSDTIIYLSTYFFFIKVITRNPNGISVDVEMENSKRTYDISRMILLFGTLNYYAYNFVA